MSKTRPGRKDEIGRTGVYRLTTGSVVQVGCGAGSSPELQRRGGREHEAGAFLLGIVRGLAGAVAFSRVTLSAHFVSDVFVGGALGYSISRFAVLRE